jgi:hypothetical protein
MRFPPDAVKWRESTTGTVLAHNTVRMMTMNQIGDLFVNLVGLKLKINLALAFLSSLKRRAG